MYIDHHLPAKDVPVVTNNAARKGERKYFVGFGKVQKDRTWIPDDRVLNTLWFDEIIEEEVELRHQHFSIFLDQLKQAKNRKLAVPAKVTRVIDEGANRVLKHQVTKIQILYDYTSNRTVWKDATPKQSEKVLLTQKWLYVNFALRNPMFYQKLLCAENIGTTIDVPVGSTFDARRWLPIKSECAPTIQYPQGDLDTCVFSSCASMIHSCGEETYAKHLITLKELSLKKNDTVHFLIDTLRNSPKLYTPKRLKPSTDTVHTLKTGMYVVGLKNKTACLNHVVSVADGWIFDSNLPYAIELNDVNLTWCTGSDHFDCFNGFWKIYQLIKTV